MSEHEAVAESDAPANAVEIGQGLLTEFTNFLESLLRPWNAYQVLIALGLFLVAFLVARIVEPKLTEWLRTREAWPKWRLRVLLVVRNRLRLVLFVTP